MAEHPTAAKGTFPYSHRPVSEWLTPSPVLTVTRPSRCSRCGARAAGVCFVRGCPWPPALAAMQSNRPQVDEGNIIA